MSPKSVERLRECVGRSSVEGEKIVVDREFFDSLLSILGYAVASIENGKIYEAREVLSEAGEVIYQKYKSILVE